MTTLSFHRMVYAPKAKMNVFTRISNRMKRSAAVKDERLIVDHVKVDVPLDWRQARLVGAAVRHGKPFKCAGEKLPREVLIGGKHRIAVID